MTNEQFGFCLFLSISFLLFYPLLRSAVWNELRLRKVRKRDIRHRIRGMGNFWLYRTIHKEYNLGWKYWANGLFLALWVLLMVSVLLRLRFGVVVLCGLLAIVLTCTNTYSIIVDNQVRFGRPLVLFDIYYDANNRRRLTWIGFDLFGIAVPLLMAGVMIWKLLKN